MDGSMRVGRLISYFVTHVNSNNIVMWWIHYNNAGLDYFKILIMPVTWNIRNQHREESYVFLEVKHLCQISWIGKKQTSVSHSSSEAEVISLDAGLRMDGIPALDLWNLVIEVFHSSQNQSNKTKDSSAQETCGIASRQAHGGRIKPKLQAREFWIVSYW